MLTAMRGLPLLRMNSDPVIARELINAFAPRAP